MAPKEEGEDEEDGKAKSSSPIQPSIEIPQCMRVFGQCPEESLLC
jgi:hypothetical protein